jgi:hypothetical protein
MSHNKNGEPKSWHNHPLCSRNNAHSILNHGCERPFQGFECHLAEDAAECIRWIYALSWHINGGTNSMYFWDSNTPSFGQQATEDSQSHVYDMWLLVTTCPQWLTYVGLCFHIVWCTMKDVGDREILKTYLNSASKNTSETDIFPHGTKSLLTSVNSYINIVKTDSQHTPRNRVAVTCKKSQ